MSALFEGGFRKVVDLEDLENEFYKHVKAIKDKIFQWLLRLGYYHHRPDKIVQAYLGAGLATTVFLILGLGFFGNRIDAFYLPLGMGGLAALLTAVPIIGFGFIMPARTVRGARKLEYVLGFQNFLDRVESYHFRRMIDSPKMFERHLPHAMALQVEKSGPEPSTTCTGSPPTGTLAQQDTGSGRRSS